MTCNFLQVCTTILLLLSLKENSMKVSLVSAKAPIVWKVIRSAGLYLGSIGKELSHLLSQYE